MLPKEGERTTQPLSAESRAAKSLAAIVTLFVFCWTPLYTLNTIVYFCPGCTEKIPSELWQCAIILTHLNSAFNPFLYAWGMKDFKGALYRLLGVIKHSANLVSV